jgi:hypothetical protein
VRGGAGCRGRVQVALGLCVRRTRVSVHSGGSGAVALRVRVVWVIWPVYTCRWPRQGKGGRVTRMHRLVGIVYRLGSSDCVSWSLRDSASESDESTMSDAFVISLPGAGDVSRGASDSDVLISGSSASGLTPSTMSR